MANLVGLYHNHVHLEVAGHSRNVTKANELLIDQILYSIPRDYLYRARLIAIRIGNYLVLVKNRYSFDEALEILRSKQYYLCKKPRSLDLTDYAHILIDEQRNGSAEYIFV